MFIKKSKYGSVKTEIDGIIFHSKLEARFYTYFKNNNIEILELQPSFILQDKFRYKGKGIRDIKYVADFKIRYNGETYYIDSKGMEDAVFRIKHKIWLNKYGSKDTLIIAKSIKHLQGQIG